MPAPPSLAGAGDYCALPSAELALRAEGGAGLLSPHRTETGQVLTGRLCRHGEAVWASSAGRLTGATSWTQVRLRALGPPDVEAPRRLRGSGDAELRRPERGPAAVGALPAGRPLRLSSIRDLGGLPVPVVRSLQQLQHSSHLGERGGVLGAPPPQPTPGCGPQGHSWDRCALASEKSPFSAASMALCAM